MDTKNLFSLFSLGETIFTNVGKHSIPAVHLDSVLSLSYLNNRISDAKET